MNRFLYCNDEDEAMTNHVRIGIAGMTESKPEYLPECRRPVRPDPLNLLLTHPTEHLGGPRITLFPGNIHLPQDLFFPAAIEAVAPLEGMSLFAYEPQIRHGARIGPDGKPE